MPAKLAPNPRWYLSEIVVSNKTTIHLNVISVHYNELRFWPVILRLTR